MKIRFFALAALISITPAIHSRAIIINGGTLQLGDNVACFCLAKILSLKYDIPFFYTNFLHSELLCIDEHEKRLTLDPGKYANMRVACEEDIIQNKDKNIIFWTDLETRIDTIDSCQIEQLLKDIRLKSVPDVPALPKDTITIGLHIRKGNGGGQHYDGEQTSEQLFDFDRAQVHYVTYENFPFDWQYYQRNNGFLIADHSPAFKGSGADKKKVDRYYQWETRFPPDQFYIDQLQILSTTLNNRPMTVYICTDDKEPEELVARIEHGVNRPNITFCYQNDRHLSFKDRMHRDLYILSQCDVLIRGSSYFARTAELMGQHALVIYPLGHHWEGNKLIMHEIVVKGSITQLLN